MKYQAPKCCGNNLTVFADVSIATHISADGKPAMRSPQVFDFTVEYLFCHICKSRYKPEIDDNGRILKGERIGN